MAETPGGTREELIALRDELAQDDPAMLEIDLDDPSSAKALVITAALLRGDGFRLEVDGEKRTETFALDSLGHDPDGQLVRMLTVTSSDGILSQRSADLVASLIQSPPAAGTDGITGESSGRQ